MLGQNSTVSTTLPALPSNNFHLHFVIKPIDGFGGIEAMLGTNQTNSSFCNLTGGYGVIFGGSSNTVTTVVRNGCNTIGSFTQNSTFSVDGSTPFSVDFIKNGTSLTLMANGITLINATDASPLSISSAGLKLAFSSIAGGFIVSDLRVTNPTQTAYTQYPTASTFNIVTQSLSL